MPGVPRTELSPGTQTSVDAMTRTLAAQNEAATYPWLRWYAVVVLFIVATPSRASVGMAGHIACPDFTKGRAGRRQAAND